MQEGNDMQILAVQAKEIHVTMELSITTVRSMLRCMDASVVELDMTNEDNKRAYAEFNEFFIFLNEFNKGIKDGRIE